LPHVDVPSGADVLEVYVDSICKGPFNNCSVIKTYVHRNIHLIHFNSEDGSNMYRQSVGNTAHIHDINWFSKCVIFSLLPSSEIMKGGLCDHLDVCVILSAPNFLVFFVVHVISKESWLLVLPRTYCHNN
jgi:hypothetical protein